MTFHQNEPFDSSFSLVHIDASIANAFRRIMLAEVPTLCIENVFIRNNTSIIHDEILSQRLGLIPLTGPLEYFRWLKPMAKGPDGQAGAGQIFDENTVILKLDIECTWKEGGWDAALKGETDPKKLYNNSSVYAKQITYHPQGRQGELFSEEIGVMNPDILIAKMRPGQVIKLEMHAHQGIGADHAKFSPVATASYRLMPRIDIIRPIVGPDAKKFARCFPKGVIDLKQITATEARKSGSGYEGHEGEAKAVVKDSFRDTMSRECLRHDEFKEKVKLGRVQDHFIFRVESTGQFESDEIFLESVRILRAKCQRMKRHLANLTSPAAG